MSVKVFVVESGETRTYESMFDSAPAFLLKTS